jgi:TRAP-type C4-dicarboxylate transport system substrate-binding protein
MRLGRRTILLSLAASVAGPAVLRLARADAPQVTLKLHHFFSSVSGGHEKFLAPWARKVEAEAGGRIRIDIFPSMQLGGAPTQLLDQAREGTADIVWAVPSSAPGRVAKIEVFELPFLLSRRAVVNSKAIEDYAAANLQDEFRDVHPICFSCRDHGVLHANRAIAHVGDLKGLRLHVPNRLAGEAARALGALAVTVPIAQVPMAITGHVIDACLDPWDMVPSLRLNDFLKSHTDFAESAPSTSTFVLAMNRTAYERLPRDLKTVIDSNSGQVAAGMAGAMWDLEAEGAADMVRRRGDTVTVLTADEVAHWRKATEPVIAAWQKQMKERKVDGGKLIATVKTLLTKYADEPEPEPPRTPQAIDQKIVSEPQQAPQAKAEFARSKADAPAAAPPQSPPVSAPMANAPVARPAPAAATRAKELDIPL